MQYIALPGLKIGGRKTKNVLGRKRSEKAVKRFNFDGERSSLTNL